MNKFAASWASHQERVLTENGAETFDTSANANVDLFFTVGALRGQPVDKLYRYFAKAFGENPYIATRIMLWARDVRGGAGERKIFRDLLKWLEVNDPDVLSLVIPKVPEIGRWDDLLVLETSSAKTQAFDFIAEALNAGDGLAAKWMPRKGPIAGALRSHLGLSPKSYRKLLVGLTNVVETQMCAKNWESINYQHVPSLAQSRYRKAFYKHDELRYTEFGAKAKAYAEAVASGDTAKIASTEKVKINAGAVYPYDVLKNYISVNGMERIGTSISSLKNDALDTVRAQWLTLPNYVGNKLMLPMIDLSGSMWSAIDGNLKVIDVSVSLGLYLANKNTGPFHNMWLGFSDNPTLVHLKGEDVMSHLQQINNIQVGYSTNVEAGFKKILDFAIQNKIPQEDMPEILAVLSDMEFNQMQRGGTAFETVKALYAKAGYKMPTLVWWNLQSRGNGNVPVKADEAGNILVSGFSPTIAKSFMSGDGITPQEIMMKVIMDSRYDLDMVKVA